MNCKLIAKEPLYYSGRMWRLSFEAPGIEAEPGQFVNIAVDGHYLRRPISVSEYDDGILSLIIQPVGDGTRRIVETPVGARLDMLTGLGNTFSSRPDISTGNESPLALLIGGGVGYAPLVGLMKKLTRQSDIVPYAIFGFNGEPDVPYEHIVELREEGYHVEYCTMTGEMGDRGNALEVALEHMDNLGVRPSYFYTCGPMPMMRAVADALPCDGELSLEARMGCGFGACMGCSIRTNNGFKRICKDGPVFKKSELF